jgi:hypothetical protein
MFEQRRKRDCISSSSLHTDAIFVKSMVVIVSFMRWYAFSEDAIWS